jgi:hypothetical protein
MGTAIRSERDLRLSALATGGYHGALRSEASYEWGFCSYGRGQQPDLSP